MQSVQESQYFTVLWGVREVGREAQAEQAE